MSSRRDDEANRLTSALTGANLALSIAREATDAVPIAKQVLGAALHIVGLAEKMDNDREALRALGASSLQLARQVTAVVAGKTPNDGMKESPGRVLKALSDIESFMKLHAARNRLRRFISYAFTVPQHVKRLSGDLANAVRDLTILALLSVDHQVNATLSAVEDNARFDGEFRLLRHCEVQKLESILWQETAVVRYHCARVDGDVFVVRYFEGPVCQQSSSAQTPEDPIFNRIAVNDSILKEISSVQSAPRNVARIYGWSRGPARDRFTVFKAGHQPFENILCEFPNPLVTGIHWTLKVLDAVLHLQLMGIFWCPYTEPYALDDQLEPIIGLQTDLHPMDPDLDQLSIAHGQLFSMTAPRRSCAELQSVPAAKFQNLLAGCLNKRLANLLGGLETIQRERCIVPKAECSDRRILTDGAAKFLLRILEDEAFVDGWLGRNWMWANILLTSAKNLNHPLMGSLEAVCFAYSSGRDHIYLYGIDQDQERIVYDMYSFDVPDAQQDEVRQMFGIAAPSEGQYLTTRVIAPGTYCMLE